MKNPLNWDGVNWMEKTFKLRCCQLYREKKKNQELSLMETNRYDFAIEIREEKKHGDLDG